MADDENRIIKYKGLVLETKYYHDMTDDECAELITKLTKKPEIKEVIDNIVRFDFGGNNIKYITNYYFRDLMYKCRLYHSKWCIDDVLNCNDLIRHFYAKTLCNDLFYDKAKPITYNMESAFRTCGKGVAQKISNFPPNTVQSILDKYNVNNNYYDPSCGWGVRMISAIRERVNYYGTDPNTDLVERLEQVNTLYQENFDIQSDVKIYCQGSEVFIPELENKMGLVFTSPPYFGLEEYNTGDQSYNEGMEYQGWLDKFMLPTLINIKKYLIDEGVCIINIKGYSKFDLYVDTLKVAKSIGLFLVDEISFENIKRLASGTKGSKTIVDSDESMMVLRKINSNVIKKYGSNDDLFD